MLEKPNLDLRFVLASMYAKRFEATEVAGAVECSLFWRRELSLLSKCLKSAIWGDGRIPSVFGLHITKRLEWLIGILEMAARDVESAATELLSREVIGPSADWLIELQS